MFFFKRKPAEPICKHTWELIDYDSYVDSSLAVVKRFKLGCLKCNRDKTVDEYDYGKMNRLGLIKTEGESE